MNDSAKIPISIFEKRIIVDLMVGLVSFFSLFSDLIHFLSTFVR